MNNTYFEHGYALIIGINSYKQIRGLPIVIMRDIIGIEKVIYNPDICAYPKHNVRLLYNENATVEEIRKAFDWLVKAAGSEATAFIYFSGHGLKISTTEQERWYLLPYECDQANLSHTAIDSEELTALLSKIPAQRLLFCLDCCYAGGIGEIKGIGDPFQLEPEPLDENDYRRLAVGTGRVILASSLKDETSIAKYMQENSLFTGYLLKALQGEAHIRGDGFIRVMDIFHYISENMRQQNQHAIFKATTQDNFPVALYNGDKLILNNSPLSQSPGASVDKQKLRSAMRKVFTRDDLKLLCADIESALIRSGTPLEVSLDIIGGNDSLPNQILSLITYMENNGYLDVLVQEVKKVRPYLDLG